MGWGGGRIGDQCTGNVFLVYMVKGRGNDNEIHSIGRNRNFGCGTYEVGEGA